MIYIERDRLDEHGTPIRPNVAWFERAETATLQAIQERGQHDVQRTIYADHQVKIALLKLFHDKCAYCESELRNVVWDVEHYRPKKSIKERPDHGGYYWLAYDWKNLLPSCQRCNRRFWELRRWAAERPVAVGGKATQFPLADETTRKMAHDDATLLVDEATLLIHPCEENPELHFRFDVMGQIFGVSEKGETTIDVCFLQRYDLTTLRRDVVETIIQALTALNIVRRNGNINAIASLEYFIQRYVANDARYAAVSRFVLDNPAVFGI